MLLKFYFCYNKFIAKIIFILKYLFIFIYRVAGKHWHIVWCWYFTTKIGKSLIIFYRFCSIFYVFSYDELYIYFLCSYGVLCSLFSYYPVGGKCISSETPTSKTVQKMLSSGKKWETLMEEKIRLTNFFQNPNNSEQEKYPKWWCKPEFHCNKAGYFYSKYPEHY